jgi:DNA-binding NarL/FixJ family response regulator
MERSSRSSARVVVIVGDLWFEADLVDGRCTEPSIPPATPSRRGPVITGRLGDLTDREAEILLLLADGLSNAEIAT